MKKIVVMLVLFILVAFSGCGQVKSLSGKYVNEQDKNEYLKFSGESTVEMYSDGEKITGTYFIYADAVWSTFGSGDKAKSELFAIKNKSTLIYNGVGVAFVKKTFWNYYWKKLVLITVVMYGVLFIINLIKSLKKNGKNLGKAINEALEQTENMIDNMDGAIDEALEQTEDMINKM